MFHFPTQYKFSPNTVKNSASAIIHSNQHIRRVDLVLPAVFLVLEECVWHPDFLSCDFVICLHCHVTFHRTRRQIDVFEFVVMKHKTIVVPFFAKSEVQIVFLKGGMNLLNKTLSFHHVHIVNFANRAQVHVDRDDDRHFAFDKVQIVIFIST